VPRPLIIAHRGASRERPENTLPAFARAEELGADGIELDVHATRDGVVVVHHDPVPRGPVADPALAGKPIAALRLRELRTIPVAPGTAMPPLAQVLRTIHERIEVFVEVKAPGIERHVVETITAAHASERCAVHAFDHRAIRRVRDHAPRLRTGILLSSALVDPAAALRAAHANDYWVWREFVDDALLASVHEAGGRVIVWTVNAPDEMRALAALGVDGICTDVVAEARAALDDGRV
jgi:glycerophosphoryl diester phosphodiesterase